MCKSCCALWFVLWCLARADDPSSLPVLSVQLKAPKVQLAQVRAVAAELERSSEAWENAALADLQFAYDKSLARARPRIERLVQQSTRQISVAKPGLPSFLSAVKEKVLYEVKLVLNPVTEPDGSLETSMRNVENARQREAEAMVRRACREMELLTTVVLDQLEVALKDSMMSLRRAAQRQPGFLQSRASKLPSLANVRLLPSNGFQTVPDVAATLEQQRDKRQEKVRARSLELQAQLLKAENALIEHALDDALRA
ncbi:unnamed protein product [Effrenium voratum]|nr:unnamed protein product [Effrenium voratum]